MNHQLPCEVVRDLLPLYADGLLTPESEEAVRPHLEQCPACRRLYEQMTAPEPVLETELPAVDYLKKVQNSRRRALLGALAAVVLAVGGMFVYLHWFSPQNRTTVSYDEPTKTLIVNGRENYSELVCPAEAAGAVNLDAQDDNFHLSVYLPVLRTEGQDPVSCLPDYLDRTDRSLRFLRDYIRENLPGSDCARQTEKFVELTIRKSDHYAWQNDPDRICVELGDFYWHREELYLLGLMNPATVEWQQLGYAWYLGTCLDPYSEMRAGMTKIESAPYYAAYLRAGGNPDPSSPEDYQKLFDAVSWQCLTEGMGWGSYYESYPVSETAFYTGKGKPILGNKMSVAMAASFIGYLCEQYGFERVSAFCFGRASFPEAFSASYEEAYAAWSDWIMQTCGA